MGKHRIAVIGIGKIARDQHLKVIDRSPDFTLAACVSQSGTGHGGVPVFRTFAEFHAAMPEVRLVAICSPPSAHHAVVRQALDAGCDVLLEKPPTPTLSEFDDLVQHAARRKRVLFQTWHSRFNEAVEAARQIIKVEGIASVRIDWRESVRKWHPGQDWVWEPGGFGVCDPGINALSIFTRIVPFPVFVTGARLSYPANRQTPIDVQIVFGSSRKNQPAMSAHFNWLEETGEIWTIAIETVKGTPLTLEKGGTVLKVNGGALVENPSEEYELIYERFARLIRKRKSEVDASPLRLVGDAFMIGQRDVVEAFEW